VDGVQSLTNLLEWAAKSGVQTVETLGKIANLARPTSCRRAVRRRWRGWGWLGLSYTPVTHVSIKSQSLGIQRRKRMSLDTTLRIRLPSACSLLRSYHAHCLRTWRAQSGP
jgi:hypothetical protein